MEICTYKWLFYLYNQLLIFISHSVIHHIQFSSTVFYLYNYSEFHGYYQVDGPDTNTVGLLNSQMVVQFGNRAPRLLMVEGKVVKWKVDVASTEPVTLAFWREGDNQLLE